MDDKLREIIESKKDDREVAEFAGITLTLAEYDYLIEQAERVEEMEKQLHGIELNLLNDEVVRLEKQNQHYKQALGRILGFYPGVPNADFIPVEMLFEIKNIARKVLEANEY